MAKLSKQTLLFVCFILSVYGADNCFSSGSSLVTKQPFNLFWTETHIELYSGALCMLTTYDDTMITYMYPEIEVYYYPMKKDSAGTGCVPQPRKDY